MTDTLILFRDYLERKLLATRYVRNLFAREKAREQAEWEKLMVKIFDEDPATPA